MNEVTLCVCCQHTEHADQVYPDRLAARACNRCGQPCVNSKCDHLRPNRTGIYGKLRRVKRWLS